MILPADDGDPPRVEEELEGHLKHHPIGHLDITWNSPDGHLPKLFRLGKGRGGIDAVPEHAAVVKRVRGHSEPVLTDDAGRVLRRCGVVRDKDLGKQDSKLNKNGNKTESSTYLFRVARRGFV